MTLPFFRTLGEEGPALAITHGVALSHDDLAGVGEAAAGAGWQVLLWDMPGHGRSGATRDYSAAAMAQALDRVIAAAGIERATLLGFSYGGMVSQYWARANPDRLDALVAYGCFAPFTQKPPLPRFAIAPFITLTQGVKPWPALRRSFAAACAVSPDARAQVERAADRLGKPGFMAASRALLEAFVPDAQFRLDCPVLLIRGEKDSNAALLAPATESLAAVARAADRVAIAGAGHCAHLDQPGAFREAVLAFLARVRPGALAASRSAGG